MMLGCLRDRTLLKLVAGDGTTAQRSHLAGCHRCQSQYQRLVRQFHVIEQILLTTDPPAVVVRARERTPIWWVPAVAAFACALLLLSWQGGGQTPLNAPNVASLAPSVQEDREEEISAFLADAVTPALFAGTETEQAASFASRFLDDDHSIVLAEDSSLSHVGEWPCDESDLFASSECELVAGSDTLEEF